MKIFFSKILDGKVSFVLKVYDLTITNVDFLANPSNHKTMFPEYSKNIPRISVSKIFQGYPRNIVRLQRCFHDVKKFKKLFCGLSCEKVHTDVYDSYLKFQYQYITLL